MPEPYSHSYRADTPFSTVVCGLPVSTLTATCASLALYLVSIVVMLSIGCRIGSPTVLPFFIFLLVAVVALISMASLNSLYPHYRFNCLSLSVSLLYSGSAALILYGLINSSISGLCQWPQTPPGAGVFKSKSFGNMIVWFVTLIGLMFQIVAHYYYG